MKTRITILIILAILASGCADNTNTGSGKGLVVEKFSISDNTLRPNQQANLRVTLKNYHERPTTINQLRIFNEGKLDVQNKTCTSDDIKPARDNLYPQLSCTWTVKAPDQSFVDGFESKNTPLKLKLNYTTEFENSEALKVNFQKLENIDRSDTKRISFSNGEVAVTAETETPVPTGSPTPIQMSVENNGPGRIDGDYSFSFTPSEIVNCDKNSKSPVVDDRVEFSCSIESGIEGVRNVFITTSYKYIKSPNLDISVVNNQ